MDSINIDEYNIEYLKKYYKGNIDDAIKRLASGEPVQYIVGDVDFYGLNIDIDKRVLIPRFDTEELVEKTYNIIKRYFNDNIDIIDLGTGSGCISLALKHLLPNANITGVDISSEALLVAAHNSKKLNLDVNFIENDMLENINNKYDVIISNPPYLSKEISYVEHIVDSNEPKLALYAPNNGLYFYDKILSTCKNNLKEKYLIAFEMDEFQGETIKELAYKYLGNNIEVVIEKALNGNDRFIFIKSK